MSAIKLTLAQRYDISRYARRLPCTLELRFAIDSFFEMIEFTPEEIQTNGISIDEKTFELICNDPLVSIEINAVPEAVKKSMKTYIEALDTDDNKNNVLLQKTFEAFKIII